MKKTLLSLLFVIFTIGCGQTGNTDKTVTSASLRFDWIANMNLPVTVNVPRIDLL